MRKRTIKNVADTIFWYGLYFLPIIITIIQSIGLFDTFSFADWQDIFKDGNFIELDFFHLLYCNLSSFGFNGIDIMTASLDGIFGIDGILPFVEDLSPIFMYFGYFVCVYLCHLLIDFILFIPRLCHKWLNAFTRSEE